LGTNPPSPENTLTVQFEREKEPGLSSSSELTSSSTPFLSFLAARSSGGFAENPARA